MFTVIDNLVTALLIPLLFPIVEREAYISNAWQLWYKGKYGRLKW